MRPCGRCLCTAVNQALLPDWGMQRNYKIQDVCWCSQTDCTLVFLPWRHPCWKKKQTRYAFARMNYFCLSPTLVWMSLLLPWLMKWVVSSYATKLQVQLSWHQNVHLGQLWCAVLAENLQAPAHVRNSTVTSMTRNTLKQNKKKQKLNAFLMLFYFSFPCVVLWCSPSLDLVKQSSGVAWQQPSVVLFLQFPYSAIRLPPKRCQVSPFFLHGSAFP